MIWAFVDYENVGSFEGINLTDYDKIIVFCGPRNTKLKFGIIPSSEFCSIERIGVTTMGNNNLDFHLAFHLGRFHEIADRDVTFHIISNDAGFNGLVNHLKKIGRDCKRVSTKSIPPMKSGQTSLSDSASLVLSRLEQLDGRKRPRKKAKFLNWIKSQCQGVTNCLAQEEICKELVATHKVQASGTDITYKIGR